MNRFKTTKGQRSGSVISRGTSGVDLTYDAAGRRTSATSTVGGIARRENYGYTYDGYLQAVTVQVTPATDLTDFGTAKTLATYTRDAMGRVTHLSEYEPNGTTISYTRDLVYNGKSEVLTEQTNTLRDVGSGNDRTMTSSAYSYGSASDGTGPYSGALRRVQTRTWTNDGSSDVTSQTTCAYDWWDGRRQTAVVSTGGENRTTSYDDDVFGRLRQMETGDAEPRVEFVTDANGVILQRDEVHEDDPDRRPREVYYYFNGIAIGDISNNGTSNVDYVTSVEHRYDVGEDHGVFRYGQSTGTDHADFDQSYDPINGFNQDPTASRYTVQAGDTLASIAQAVWGDGSLWYMLADVNGLDGSETLAAGRTLIIPNKVANFHNNASTWRVYDPNQAISGDASPGYVKPYQKSNGCGVFGQIILVVIAVAVTVLATAGAAAVLTNTGFNAAFGALTTGTALGGATAATWVAAGAIGGAVGSAVSQGVGVATGLQDGFSWKQVGLSAIAGGVGGGVGPGGAFGGDGLFGGGIWAAAARGAVSSAVTQGIGVATGLQDRFSWANVAASGVGAGVGRWVGGGPIVSGMAGGIAGAAAVSLVTGRSFGDTLMSSLPSIIGNTIGNLVASEIAGDSTSGETLTRYAENRRDDGTRSDSPPIESDRTPIFVNGRKLSWPGETLGRIFSGGSKGAFSSATEIARNVAMTIGQAQIAEAESYRLQAEGTNFLVSKGGRKIS